MPGQPEPGAVLGEVNPRGPPERCTQRVGSGSSARARASRPRETRPRPRVASSGSRTSQRPQGGGRREAGGEEEPGASCFFPFCWTWNCVRLRG